MGIGIFPYGTGVLGDDPLTRGTLLYKVCILPRTVGVKIGGSKVKIVTEKNKMNMQDRKI